MSYKVLARKWRPHHFRDMLGQEPVLRALVNALDSDRLHHAYLFTGMRGVGKTTIARIFAKCLNCETKGVTSDPCGTCSACRDIDAGRFFDLIEVDAASRTKVESTRELLENVPYAPASGRYKVYLIDEVHMFSKHSFNALLKTLEEPPEHVKFLLATTDPQKVPATVLSRCLQFNLKRMSPGILTTYLSKILTEEGIAHEVPALDLIARASEGSVRDSLSLVEQAASSGEGAVRAADVEGMLGRASVDRLLSLIETLAAGDMPALFLQVDELAQYAPEFSDLLGEILSLLHRVAMLRTVPGSVPEATPGYDRLSKLATEVDPDVVQLFYQIGLHARRDMPFAPDLREAFDMALLRMHAFRPQDGAGAIVASESAPALTPAVGQPAVDKAESRVSGLEVRGSVSAGGSMRAAALAAARGEPLPVSADAGEAVSDKPVKKSVDKLPESIGSTIDKADVTAGDWPQLVSELDVAGMPLQLANNCTWLGFNADCVQLQLEESAEHLCTDQFVKRLRSALSDWFGRDVQLKIEQVTQTLETPARIAQKQADDDMAAAHDSIKFDPNVRLLIDKVDGAVDEASIRPINRSNDAS